MSPLNVSRGFARTGSLIFEKKLDTLILARLIYPDVRTSDGEENAERIARGEQALVEQVASDLVRDVTCREAFDWPSEDPDEFGVTPARRARRRLKIAAYDFGMKWNILRRLSAHFRIAMVGQELDLHGRKVGATDDTFFDRFQQSSGAVSTKSAGKWKPPWMGPRPASVSPAPAIV